jgi:hypothetical protein
VRQQVRHGERARAKSVRDEDLVTRVIEFISTMTLVFVS